MKLYGLIGRPLTHSFSKAYFAEKFRREHIEECRYENFELQTIAQLQTILNTHTDLQGLNVTIPYKKEVLPFLHEKNEIVDAINACNCIHIKDGRLHGYNTDVIGFRKSLQPYLKPHHTKALVLGTGGSSGAVQYALQQLGIAYALVSRQKGGHSLTYNELNADVLAEHTVIINTTPVGMYPNVDAAPDLPYQFITSRHLLFDLIYNPEQTVFLQRGAAQGATISNGHAMLVLQAEESWDIWNGG
jgi:shikimate dehydrogenase